MFQRRESRGLTKTKSYEGYTSDEAYQAAQMALIEQIECAKRTTQDVYEDGELVFEEGVTLGENENITLISKGSLVLLCFLPLGWCHLHI